MRWGRGGGGYLLFSDVVQHHVDIVVIALECAGELLVSLHDDPDLRTDALVHQF